MNKIIANPRYNQKRKRVTQDLSDGLSSECNRPTKKIKTSFKDILAIGINGPSSQLPRMLKNKTMRDFLLLCSQTKTMVVQTKSYKSRYKKWVVNRLNDGHNEEELRRFFWINGIKTFY